MNGMAVPVFSFLDKYNVSGPLCAFVRLTPDGLVRSGHSRLTPVNLAGAEVNGQPAFDLPAGFGGLAVPVVFVPVFLDAVGGKCEDQVLAKVSAFFSVDAVHVIDILHGYSRRDILGRFAAGFSEFGKVCFRVIRGSPGPFHSCCTQVCLVEVRICDFQSLVINILRSHPIHGFVDSPDLGIRQVEVGRQSVSGRRVGLIQGSGRNRIRQIDPEKVVLPEFSGISIFSVVRYSGPLLSGNNGAVLDGLAVSRGMAIDTGAVIEHCVKIEGIQLRDIGVRIVVRIGQCGQCRCGCLCFSVAGILGAVFQIRFFQFRAIVIICIRGIGIFSRGSGRSTTGVIVIHIGKRIIAGNIGKSIIAGGIGKITAGNTDGRVSVFASERICRII